MSLIQVSARASGLFCALVLVASAATLPVRSFAADALSASLVTVDGTWANHSPESAGPPPEESMTGFYDAVRSRIILFGGWNGGPLSTTWQLSLAGGTQHWTQLAAGGSAPPARYGHEMVYDSARDRLLVFGGSNDGYAQSRFNDVWALDLAGTPTWSQLNPIGAPPSARLGSFVVYDPAGDRLIVFGGYDGAFENDLYQLSLSGTPSWSPINPQGSPPTQRDYGVAIYDPAQARMVLFGGNVSVGGNPAVAVNDVWTLNLGGIPTWAPLATAGTTPPARLLHAGYYDAGRNRLVTMGGTDAHTWFNDTWTLSLSGTPTWSSISALGAVPSQRSDHVFVYDAANDRAIAFGGRHPDPFLNDVWSLGFSGLPAWTQVLPVVTPGPSKRLLHKSVYDSSRDQYITFGGTDARTWFNDTWALSLGALGWTQLGTGSALVPARRSDHLLVRDSARDRLILFGGRDLNNFFGDLWAFNEATQTWTTLSPAGTGPVAREAMAGFYDAVGDRVILFGGWDGHHALNDVWELDFSPSLQWQLLKPGGKPPAGRYAHMLLADPANNRAILTGGYDGVTVFDETWSLELAGSKPNWHQLHTAGNDPGPRTAEDAVYDSARQRLIILGGWDGQFKDDVYALDIASTKPLWSKLNPQGTGPVPHDYTSSIYDPVRDRVLTFGGNFIRSPGTAAVAGNDLWTLEFGGVVAGTPLPVDGRIGYPANDGELAFGIAPSTPDPVVGAVQVEFRLAQSAPATLDLIDVRGRRVAHEDVSAGTGRHRVTLAADHVPAGVYFVRLVQGASLSQRKIVVLR